MKEKYITEKASKKRGTYYQVTIAFTTSTGKRATRSCGQFYVKSYGDKKTALRQAIKARDKALQEIEMGMFEHPDMTVDDCFQASLDLFNLSAKTKEWHRIIYDAMITEDLKHKSVTKVTTEDVILNMNTFAETHSQDSVSRCKTVWHQIFQTGLE